MHEYDFIGRVSQSQVQQIISKAGYSPASYNYSARVDNDGYLVTGNDVMNLTILRGAAKVLGFNKRVEISSPNVAGAGDSGFAEVEDGTPYSVSIDLSSKNTYEQLNDGGYLLYGFKAVQTRLKGVPVVWFAGTGPFEPKATVNWSEQYQAYITDSQAISQGSITNVNASDISLDQTMNVAQDGSLNVVDGGTASAISINNTSNNPYTCGISEMQGDTAVPMCAFPLFGNHMDVIAPIEKILLMFSTNPVNTGTVVQQSYSQGILIDLTASQTRAVSYDMNDGWSTPGGELQQWATIVPANAALVPLLIDSSQPSANRRLRR
jgi:hypothetical protein